MRVTEWCLFWGGEDANDCAMHDVYDDPDEAIADQQWKGGQLSFRTVEYGRWHSSGSAPEGEQSE